VERVVGEGGGIDDLFDDWEHGNERIVFIGACLDVELF
jgi:hypothetical protein